jgi:hypothetical protein
MGVVITSAPMGWSCSGFGNRERSAVGVSLSSRTRGPRHASLLRMLGWEPGRSLHGGEESAVRLFLASHSTESRATVGAATDYHEVLEHLSASRPLIEFHFNSRRKFAQICRSSRKTGGCHSEKHRPFSACAVLARVRGKTRNLLSLTWDLFPI